MTPSLSDRITPTEGEVEDRIQALASVYTFSSLGDRDRAVACMQGLAGWLTDAFARHASLARIEGARAMQEMAAKVCDHRQEVAQEPYESAGPLLGLLRAEAASTSEQIADAIRSLDPAKAGEVQDG